MTVTTPRPRRRLRRLLWVPVLAVLAVVGVLLAVLGPSTDRRLVDGGVDRIEDGTFYQVQTPVPPGRPGTIVRTERIYSAPDGAIAWRVLYHSTDALGADIVVSGLVVAPEVPAPTGGRVVVGWGHPTTGAVARCAPSNGLDPFILIEGMTDLLDAGYVIAAADYPGLGVPGQSSYLIGASEGTSVLDAVRAAAQLPGTGAGSDVLLWGHSQGGQAVLFAGQQARRYAPELRVRGVAVAAPAADLGTLLEDHVDDISGVTLGSYAFAAYQSVYSARIPRLDLTSILTDAGAAATPALAALCLIGEHDELHAEAAPLVGRYLHGNPATTEPWATLLRENTPGAQPLAVPLFVAQGDADTLVLPGATRAWVATECADGEHVTLRTYPDTGHGMIALKAMPAVLSFLRAVLAGAPPASTC